MIIVLPITASMTLKGAKRDYVGTWRVLPGSNEQIYVAVDVDNKVKPGTWFGPDLRATRATKLKKGQLVMATDNAYKFRRAYLLHIAGWVTMRLAQARNMNRLGLMTMNATYGNALVDEPAFVALQTEMQPIIDAVPGDPLYQNNRRMRRATELFRVHPTRVGSRNRLGLASIAIQTADRADELDGDMRCVVSYGTIVANYIDGVIGQVKELLPELEQKLSLVWQEAFKPAVRDYFELLAATMKDLFVVRPFVDPGAHCIRDAEEVARVIGDLMNASRGQQSDSMESIRQLMKNIIDCFKLLLWQYEFESLITEVSDAVRHRTVVTEETWNEWITVLHERRAELPEAMGRGFENNVLLEISTCLSVAFSYIPSVNRQSHLVKIKKELVRASDWVGSDPRKKEVTA